MTGRELGARARELVGRARSRGTGELEAYEKRGRSRRFERGPLGETSSQSVEAGWALRGGGAQRSWFLAGSGAPPADPTPPAATPQPLRLPAPRPARAWSPPPGLDAPLASEAEARALLDGVARELERELPGARLVAARLDEGASESALVSTLGVEARARTRSTALRFEARRGSVRVEVELLARAASELKPQAIARRAADRLSALGDGESRDERANARPVERGRLLLAAPVGARLLEAFAPRLVGAAAAELARSRERGGRRIAAPLVRIVDDGGRADGLLGAAADGEGVPTGAATLVEGGELVAPLLAWWESPDAAAALGCVRRPGWRDLPRRAPSELALDGVAEVGVGDLLAELGTGAYLIATEGGVRLAGDGDGFAVPVSGYRLERGALARPLGPALLAGRLTDWLAGIRALARDLSWVPGAALYGAPSALVDGLELSSG